jgi:putative MATE family efflux protein
MADETRDPDDDIRTTKKLDARLVALTWPLFVESLLRILMGNVNVFMLSRYSDDAVAAVGVSNQILSIFLVMYGIVGAGTAIIISQYHGAGEEATARKVAGAALVANAAFGLLMGVVITFSAPQVLRAMNLPEALMAHAVQYTRIVGAFSFSQAIFTTLAAIARSFGSTRSPMFVALGMNLLNVTGCYLAIFRPFGLPQLGVPGVAASMVASGLVGLVAMAWILNRRMGIRFRWRDLSPFPRDMVRDIVRVGAPAAGEYISYTISQMVVTFILAGIGVAALTTKIYVQNLTFFISIASMAIGQGSQILIGHLVGAGRFDDAKRIGSRSLAIALVANGVLTAAMIAVRRPLLGLFTKDEAILALGATVLLIDLAVELGRAFNHVVGNTLRGTGDVRYPMVVSILSMWCISVVLCQVLGVWAGFGLAGIWVAYAADEWSRGLVLWRRWNSGRWRDKLVIRL